MGAFEFSRCVLSVSVAAALLSACGGGASVPVAIGNTPDGPTAVKHHRSFSYTGGVQTFTVPAGVTRLAVDARGAQGCCREGSYSNAPAGFPGRVYALIPVHPGAKFYVFVGEQGLFSGSAFNGGGAGGGYGTHAGGGFGGGGASDVRAGGDKLKDRIIVAAGGGGTGKSFQYSDEPGGNGGGLVGMPGSGYPGAGNGGGGGGGTQGAGGSGGSGGQGNQSKGNGMPGSNGALGLGGSGGNGGVCCSRHHYGPGYPGGGGGGGYYGGGGGGGGAASYYSGDGGDLSGGGGGGSSYVEPSAIKSHMWTGWNTKEGNGRITFSWR